MEDVLFDVKGHVGFITLNRPKALNALTHVMCVAIHQQLDAWKDDANVQAVVIEGVGEKAFCAGGDVVALHNSGKAYRDGDTSSIGWMEFFRDEYLMNVAIAEYPKPYIALMDGITMGGGVGISAHGSHRISTERTMLAMPETGIGLFPDVGGGWFLPRLPGEMGMYLALTGDRVKAPDCETLGITNGYMPSDHLPAFLAALIAAEALDHARVSALVSQFASNADEGKLDALRGLIDHCFAADSVESVFEALEQDRGEWALKTLANMNKKSPTSMKVTYRQMRYGRAMGDIRDNMVMEYRIARHTLQGHDFYEGVRALLLDKDMAPSWQPASLADVTDAMVDAHFAPFGDTDLDFS